MPTPIPALGPFAAALAMLFAQAAAGADPARSAYAEKVSAPSAADRKLILAAMRAAPKNVSAKARVVAMDAAGKMRTLRTGSNGFICMPDNPATPGRDPMCMDQAAWAWADAWMGHEIPAAGKIGFMYMLAGATAVSNTDPFALKPTAQNHWITAGPHVMLVGADPGFYAMYPKEPDRDPAVPYVMWAGTPYQHLMISIK